MNHKKIELLTEEEKRSAIDNILAYAVSSSRQIGYFEILRAIGIRRLFFGVADAVFLAITTAIILGAGLMSVTDGTMYSVMFFTSPLTYILLYLLTMWKESLNGTLELHRTLRTTPRHITAMRMLFFGAFSMAANAVISALTVEFAANRTIVVSFARLLEVSFCSLFVFAALLLFVMLKFRGNAPQILFVLLWIIGGVFVVISSSEFATFENLLQNLPSLVLTAIAVIATIIFALESKIYFRRIPTP
jgi:hypothetical protein